MRAILAGASGLTGRHLASALAEAGASVTALVRRPVDGLPPGIAQVTCDFGKLDQRDPLPGGADAVFCALGTTIAKAGSQQAFRAVDHDAVLAVARFGLRCGARRFLLVSSVDAGVGSMNFYLRVKGETERAVGELGYSALDIFRPSFLLGDRGGGEARWAERAGIAAARGLSWLLAGPLARYRPIEAATVARAMVRAAAGGGSGTRTHHYREMVELAR